MSEMVGPVIGVVVILWLGMGGWAYRTLWEDASTKEREGLVWLCLLLAPFMAGATIADLRSKPSSPPPSTVVPGERK